VETDRYKEQLKRQMEFLKRSCELFDHGSEDEAIRIAVALRTLFRDTEFKGKKQSISIFALLGQKEAVRLLSSLETMDELHLPFEMIPKHSLPIMMTSDGQKPLLEKTKKHKLISISDWLNEKVVIIDGNELSREDIIITAANKDGGTHVPEKMNAKARLLKKSVGAYTIYENSRAITKELASHYFIILRQLAFEVLESRSIYELNDMEFQPIKKVKSYREYLQEAGSFQRENKHHKAIERFKQAINVNKNNSEIAYNNMGNSYIEIGDKEEAKIAYRKSIELNPGYVDPLVNLALVFHKEKRYDLALSAYGQALEIDNKHVQAAHNVMVIKNFMTLQDEIEYQYRNVFTGSENSNYLVLLALGLMKYSRLLEALEVMKKALEFTEEPDLVLCNIGVLCIKLGRLEEAEKTFDVLVKSTEINNAEVCLNVLEYGIVYGKLNVTHLFEKFEISFKDDKNTLCVVAMLKILYRISTSEGPIKAEIEKFNEKYSDVKMNYDLSDLESWVESKKNANLTDIFSFFKGRNASKS
jgi:tetratricopeptide (TPR) repeat protein